jgi:hypothetical protein
MTKLVATWQEALGTVRRDDEERVVGALAFFICAHDGIAGSGSLVIATHPLTDRAAFPGESRTKPVGHASRRESQRAVAPAEKALSTNSSLTGCAYAL